MGTVRFSFSLVSVQREILTRFGRNLRLRNFESIWWNFPLILRGDHRKTSHSFWEEALLGRITRSPVKHWPFCDQSFRQRPYCVEYTRSHPNSEVKLRKARSVLGWGTAWEALRVLLAFIFSWFRGSAFGSEMMTLWTSKNLGKIESSGYPCGPMNQSMSSRQPMVHMQFIPWQTRASPNGSIFTWIFGRSEGHLLKFKCWPSEPINFKMMTL